MAHPVEHAAPGIEFLVELSEAVEDIPRARDHFREALRLRAAGDMAHLNCIRDIWHAVERSVMHDLRQSGCTDPYYVDWPAWFTPIESWAWSTIRHIGLPFLPQVPVGRYLVDFGAPLQRIAIECDGAAFHNPGRDAKRDAELFRLGWRVYRVSGAECRRPDMDWETEPDECQIEDWLQRTSDGVIHAIAAIHFDREFRNFRAWHAAAALASHTLQRGWS